MMPSNVRLARSASLAVCGAVALSACTVKKETQNPDSARMAAAATALTPGDTGRAHHVGTTSGLNTPESAKYDAEQDVWYVSNINGNPSARDGNGYISRLKGDGTMDVQKFIQSGKNGATLNAPKGIAIVGDTLWVADIDAARAFNRKTGAVVATIDLRPQHAHFLNDVVAGPDGSIYITDTGIEMSSNGSTTHPGPDQVIRIDPKHKVSVVLQGSSLEGPNGITWDSAGQRFLIVGYASGKDIFSWKPGENTPTKIATGAGQWDGIEVVSAHSFLVSSWADSSVHQFTDGKDDGQVVSGVPSPADIGWDAKRSIVAVPILTGDRVEYYHVPGVH